MSKLSVSIRCSKCRTSEIVSVARYYSVAKEPQIKENLLAGNFARHKCTGCGVEAYFWVPLIYDDPAYDLFAFVADEETVDLIDEFHRLVEECRDDMGEERYLSVFAKKFQIVVGLNALARIVFALDKGIYCYRSVPALSRVADIDYMGLLECAKYYRLAGHDAKAYAAVSQGKAYFSSDPNYLRELGAYAYTAGALQDAERVLELSEEMTRKRAHVWEQIVPSEGPITQVPKEISLPKLESHVKGVYESLRPELFLSVEEQSCLAGAIIGTLEQAVADLGRIPELEFYLDYYQYRFTQLLEKQPMRSKAVLGEILSKARIACRE